MNNDTRKEIGDKFIRLLVEIGCIPSCGYCSGQGAIGVSNHNLTGRTCPKCGGSGYRRGSENLAAAGNPTAAAGIVDLLDYWAEARKQQALTKALGYLEGSPCKEMGARLARDELRKVVKGKTLTKDQPDAMMSDQREGT